MNMASDLDPDSPAGKLWYGKQSAEQRNISMRLARLRRYSMLFSSLKPNEMNHAVQDDGLWELWKKLDFEPIYISARDAMDKAFMIRY
jgi:hypothetical protein